MLNHPQEVSSRTSQQFVEDAVNIRNIFGFQLCDADLCGV